MYYLSFNFEKDISIKFFPTKKLLTQLIVLIFKITYKIKY